MTNNNANVSMRNALKQWELLIKVVGQSKWLFALLGSLGVVIHFWRARFLPQLTFSDLGLVAAAIVCFSLLAATYFTFVLFMPALSLIGLSRSRDAAQTSSIAIIGFLTACVIHLHVIASPDSSRDAAMKAYLGVAVLTFMLGVFADDISMVRDKWRSNRWRHHLGSYIYCTAMYAIVIPLSLMTFIVMVPGLRAADDDTILMFLPMLLAAHISVLATHGMKPHLRMILFATTSGFILLASGALFDSLDRGASTFRIGMLDQQTLVVTEKGRDIFLGTGISANVDPVAGASEKLYRIGPVRILTRLGNHVVIAERGWSFEKPSRSAPIPASQVLTWFNWTGATTERSSVTQAIPAAESATQAEQPAKVPTAPPAKRSSTRPFTSKDECSSPSAPVMDTSPEAKPHPQQDAPTTSDPTPPLETPGETQ